MESEDGSVAVVFSSWEEEMKQSLEGEDGLDHHRERHLVVSFSWLSVFAE